MKKVLVVDDSSTVLSLIKHEFSSYDKVECIYATTYKEAMQIIIRSHKEIKVALLDINLPDAPNGEIISLANAHKIPTIVLAGTLNKTIRDTIQKKEIISYILKDKVSSIKLAIKNVIRALNNYNTTILVVDDSATYRKSLSDILVKNNFHVLEAENGQEALDILKNEDNQISIVITDYEMPIMNGLDFVIKARELHDKNQLGILAISTISDVDVINDFLTFGADDFINKPFSPSEIMTRINSLLSIQELFKQITEIANRDFMTGMYNRRYSFENANAIFSKAKKAHSSIAVIMLDIDKFKNINDTYCHDIGDIAIKEVKNILNKHLKSSDLMSRFGGEEFCILLEDISLEETKELFEKIRDDFEKNVIDALGVQISYTVSMGIAYGLLSSLEDMIKMADKALYRSKESGRNQVTVIDLI